MQSLSRALTVLEELARQESPQTLTELTVAVGLHKSTVYRMLSTFVRHGVVQRDESNRYEVSSDVFGIHLTGIDSAYGNETVHRILSDLAKRAGAVVSLAVPRGENLERRVNFFPNGAREDTSTRLSWHASAAAKAYLAARPRTEIQKRVGRLPLPVLTSHTITDPFTFVQVLTRVRERGFAIEDREQAPSFRALGAAIVDENENATAAIELHIPTVIYEPADLQTLASYLQSTAVAVSENLYTCPCSGSRSPHLLEKSGA